MGANWLGTESANVNRHVQIDTWTCLMRHCVLTRSCRPSLAVSRRHFGCLLGGWGRLMTPGISACHQNSEDQVTLSSSDAHCFFFALRDLFTRLEALPWYYYKTLLLSRRKSHFLTPFPVDDSVLPFAILSLQLFALAEAGSQVFEDNLSATIPFILSFCQEGYVLCYR